MPAEPLFGKRAIKQIRYEIAMFIRTKHPDFSLREIEAVMGLPARCGMNAWSLLHNPPRMPDGSKPPREEIAVRPQMQMPRKLLRQLIPHPSRKELLVKVRSLPLSLQIANEYEAGENSTQLAVKYGVYPGVIIGIVRQHGKQVRPANCQGFEGQQPFRTP
jgi:hypothetical protein